MSELGTESDAPSASPAGTSDGSTLEVKFVGWEPQVDEAPRKHAPRLNHKKSRTGCQQCRSRRVKCDEVHPVCGNCNRHKSICAWGRDPPATIPSAEPQPSRSKPPLIRPLPKPSLAAPEIRESKERRLTEMYLIHHYQTCTSATMNRPDPEFYYTQSVIIPRLAFKHDALLYSLLATAALHLSHEEPNDPKHTNTYQKYLGLALRLHRDDVAKLSKANADVAMLTSSNLRICTFAQLQERPIEPYVPPVEWLQMNYGTGHGLAVAAWKFLRDDTTSIMRAMILKVNVPGLNAANPQLRDMPTIFNEDNRKDLTHLLVRSPEDEATEPWSDEVQVGYKSTVSYIGGVKQGIDAGQPEPTILRRLLVFPTMVEKEFIDVVVEGRPRALVVLAHYFALLARFRDFWWIGQAGPREVKAIQRVVEGKWLELMEWPLKAIEEEPTMRQTELVVPFMDLSLKG